MLIKRAERQARRGTLASMLPAQASDGVDRRIFLRRSGVVAGGLAALGALPLSGVRKAEAGPPPAPGAMLATRKNVCSARIARSAARSSPRLPMACGPARSRAGTRRSIAARTAAKARPCATTCSASAGYATR